MYGVIMLRITLWAGLVLELANAFTTLTSSTFTPLHTASSAFSTVKTSPYSTADQTSTRQHVWYYGEVTGVVGGRLRAAPARRRSVATAGTSMLFDFIKKRAQEGVEQTQNLVIAAQEGRLDEALKVTSEYVKERQVQRTDSTVSGSRYHATVSTFCLFGKYRQ